MIIAYDSHDATTLSNLKWETYGNLSNLPSYIISRNDLNHRGSIGFYHLIRCLDPAFAVPMWWSWSSSPVTEPARTLNFFDWLGPNSAVNSSRWAHLQTDTSQRQHECSCLGSCAETTESVRSCFASHIRPETEVGSLFQKTGLTTAGDKQVYKVSMEIKQLASFIKRRLNRREVTKEQCLKYRFKNISLVFITCPRMTIYEIFGVV